MIVVGLTGSIAMGKSTTAGLFAQAGAPVFDADAAVAKLYRRGGLGAVLVGAAFAGVLDSEGGVDRAKLRARVTTDPAAFATLEGLVHPLVARERRAFLRRCKRRGELVAILDIPLLFETGAHDRVDAVVVVTAPGDVQRQRALARPGMTARAFDAIVARQTPDGEKRAAADFVIDTSQGMASARRQVRRILADLRRRARMKRAA